MDLEPIGDEGEEFVDTDLYFGQIECHRDTRPASGSSKCLRQRHAEPVFENDSDYTLSCSAQRIRVPRSLRLFTDGKKGDQSIDLVGKGGDDTHWLGWAIITGAKRPV